MNISRYKSRIKTKKTQELQYWGLDHATLNYIYHSGLLKHLNVKLNTISQRMAFDSQGKNTKYKRNEKVLYEKEGNCSPIVRHKIYPLIQ